VLLFSWLVFELRGEFAIGLRWFGFVLWQRSLNLQLFSLRFRKWRQGGERSLKGLRLLQATSAAAAAAAAAAVFAAAVESRLSVHCKLSVLAQRSESRQSGRPSSPDEGASFWPRLTNRPFLLKLASDR